MKALIFGLIMLAIGVVSGINYPLLASMVGIEPTSTEPNPMAALPEPASDEPLFWVAPMDPNYKRDKPGKSPMGMDLVPVFDDAGSEEDEVGTVKISASVENNIGVRTAEVVRGKLASRIDTVGYIQLDESGMVHVHPRVEGWLEKLFVKVEGQKVERGEPLFNIYSPQLVAAQEEYLLALKRKEKILIDSAKTRLRALHVSPGQIKTLTEKKSVRQTVTIFAPKSGYITSLAIREGNFVKPGNQIMTIASLDKVWLMAEVFERQAAYLEKDAVGIMKLEYQPEQKWRGTVDYIYPVLDTKTRTVKVRMVFDNPDMSLKPNMFAHVSISGKPGEESVLVPKEAVIRNADSDRVVLALGDGKYKSINVSSGKQDATSIEILDGLDAGDQVVTSAHFLLDSESSITSDFKRMEPEPDRVWTQGVISSVMAGHGMLTITHEPIPDWDWGEMTMDFTVLDGVELDGFESGQRIKFEIEKESDGSYVIASVNQAMDMMHDHGMDQEEK